jgi:hypothetical protein
MYVAKIFIKLRWLTIFTLNALKNLKFFHFNVLHDIVLNKM